MATQKALNVVPVYSRVPKILEAMRGIPVVGSFTAFPAENLRNKYKILKLGAEEYVQPEVGTLYIFPKWLHHQVLPFSGAGERRSIAMNWNVIESEEEIKKIMGPNEYKNFLSIVPKDVDRSVPFLTTIGGSVLNIKLNDNE